MGTVRERAQIRSSLIAKGFEERKKSGNTDHDYFFLTEHDVKGTPIYTRLSRGSGFKTYGKELLGDLSRQLKLSKEELLQYIDCTLSKAAYIAKLEAQGYIIRRSATGRNGRQHPAPPK